VYINGYHTDIEKNTLENKHFREVLFVAPHSQFVVMTLQPREEIGQEIHPGTDPFLRVEAAAKPFWTNRNTSWPIVLQS
jgi:hypothetical protein